MKIFKYIANINDTITIPMPMGAKVLTVKLQGNIPCIWALVDPEMPLMDYTFLVRGTGHEIEALATSYIGTIQLAEGALVFHYFKN